MGYPLKNTSITAMFTSIFQLFITQEKLQKVATAQFYFKDVIRFFKHPSIQPLLTQDKENIFEHISTSINSKNDTFISQDQIRDYVKSLSKQTQNCIISIFNPFSDASNFIKRITTLIYHLRETKNALDKEYLFRFHTAFTQLQNLQKEYKYLYNIKTIYHFFNQMIAVENISFQGEPLQGLQLMGMLVTRVLDFEKYHYNFSKRKYFTC